MSSRADFLSDSGARLASSEPRARVASSASERPEGLPRDLVLRRQARPEEQRVVGAERDGDPGLRDGAQRHLGGRAVDPEGDVAPRAHLEGHAALGHHLQHPGVLGAAHAVAEAVGPQRLQGGLDRRRAEQLPGVGDQGQPGVPGDLEGAGELLGHPAPLVVAQPEAHDLAGPFAGILRRQAGQRPGVEGVPDPARRHDDRHLGPSARRGGPGLVEHDLDRRGDAADEGRVGGGVDLDLEPARPLGGVVLGRLAHDAAHVRLVADTGPRGVIEALEAEPPALVAGAEPRWPRGHERVGEADAVLLGELAQRLHPHGAGEVQVQVRLGQVSHRTRHGRSLSSRAAGGQRTTAGDQAFSMSSAGSPVPSAGTAHTLVSPAAAPSPGRP